MCLNMVTHVSKMQKCLLFCINHISIAKTKRFQKDVFESNENIWKIDGCFTITCSVHGFMAVPNLVFLLTCVV